MPVRLPDSQDTTPSNAPRGRPLTSALLSAASLVKVDKSHVLKSYISAQRSHRSHFVREGQRDWVAFDKLEGRNDDEADDAPRAKEHEVQDAGFSTPKLKARVPIPAQKAFKGNPRSDVASQRGRSRDVTEDNPQRQGGSAKKGKAREDGLATQSRTTKEQLAPKLQPVKKSRKRQRSVETEREALLADRRERRRAKKAIVDPKRDEADEEGQEKVRKKGKQDKKTKLAAGLALMHGFSADNLGSGRITMKPSFGVFHKGKASAKTRVSKAKGTAAAWSEFDFLGKTTSKPRARRSRSVDDSGSASERHTPSPASSRPSPSRKKTKICNYEPRVKSSKAKTEKTKPKPKESLTSEVVEDVEELSASEKPAARGQRESVVWEIEEGAAIDQVQDTKSVSEVASSHAPQNTGTLMLDVGSRWNVDLSRLGDSDPAFRGIGEQDEASRVSYASLCPSQSASQVGRRIALGSEAPRPAPTASKYFRVAEPKIVAEPQSTSSDTEGPAAARQVLGTPSPPPITHISSDHWTLTRRNPNAREEATSDSQDAASFTQSASQELHDPHPDLRAVGTFVPASILPRHPPSDDSMADLEKLLEDFPAREASHQTLTHPEYDDDMEGPVQEVQSLEGMYDRAFSDADAPQIYGHREGRLDAADEMYWTDEDAEYGPPLYGDTETYEDFSAPPSSAYVQDPFLAPSEFADQDVEMGAEASWDPVSSFDLGETAMYDATKQIYAAAEDMPPPSADESYVESVVTSLSDATLEDGFGEPLPLLGRGLESRWVDVAQEETTRYPTVSRVEKDVAKGLRNHWLPQRL